MLLVPVISEVAAREDLAGTRALVFSQPGVPASPVLWKTAAVALVVLMLGAPLAIQCFLVVARRAASRAWRACSRSPASSVGFGSLTSGGKLFSGLYVVVWYMGLSNLPAADFTAALSSESGAGVQPPLPGARRRAGRGGDGREKLRRP